MTMTDFYRCFSAKSVAFTKKRFFSIGVQLFLALFAICGPRLASCQTIPKRVVICPFASIDSGGKKNQAFVLSDMLMIQLANDKRLTVVDHSIIDTAAREAALTGSGIGRDADALVIGRWVKADLAVTGVYYSTGKERRVAIKIVHPKSGLLLDAAVFPVDPQDMDASIKKMERFVLSMADRAIPTDRNRYIAFTQLVIDDPGKWAGYAGDLLTRLQKRYLSCLDVGVVVRSQVDSMLVESYLTNTEMQSKRDVLRDTPNAGVLVDLELRVSKNAPIVHVTVRLDIVGLTRRIHRFELDSDLDLSEQLSTELDKILNVRCQKLSPVQRAHAEELYQQAMERVGFSYKNEQLVNHRGSILFFHDDTSQQSLLEAIELFNKVLATDPSHYHAMAALAHCYLHKKIDDELRAKNLLRTVYMGTDRPELRRAVKLRMSTTHITSRFFEGITDRPKDLLAEFKKLGYIHEKEYVLLPFMAVETPEMLNLSSPFDKIAEEVFYLMREAVGYSVGEYVSKNDEAIGHFERGIRFSGFRFKAPNDPKKIDLIAKALSWQYSYPPAVVRVETTKYQEKGKRMGQLQSAMNEFACALYLDPRFYEAMVMLSVCLQDPSIGEEERAKRLLETVLAETADEYLKYYAAAKLNKLHTTKFSSFLMQLMPDDASTHSNRRRRHKPDETAENRIIQPSQAVTMIYPETGASLVVNSVFKQKPNYSSKNTQTPTLRNETGEKPMTGELTVMDAFLAFEPGNDCREEESRKIPARKYVITNTHRRSARLGFSAALTKDKMLIGAPLAAPEYPPHGVRHDGGMACLFKSTGNDWQYIASLRGDKPGWNVHDRFSTAVDLGSRWSIAGSPFDKDKGPMRTEALRKIKFESNIDPERLADKLFRLGYLDANKISSMDSKSIKKRLPLDFPECSSKDHRRIREAIDATLRQEDSGSVTIFDMSLDPPAKLTTILAQDAHDKNQFGKCVAINASHAVVGSNSGAYFFRRKGNQWLFEKKIPADGVRSCDLFEDYAIVDVFTSTKKGGKGNALIYFFEKGQWRLQSRIEVDHPNVFYDIRQAGFGMAVAINGRYAAIGNPFENFGNRKKCRMGSVTVYKRIADQWHPYAILIAGPEARYDSFGKSISMDDSFLVVGAPESRIDNKAEVGEIHVFKLHDNGITHIGRIRETAFGAGNRFGTAVAVSGDRLLIGSPYDDGSYKGSGAAYVVDIHGE
jgi:tetratricopeptide (TPR) repeat protein